MIKNLTPFVYCSITTYYWLQQQDIDWVERGWTWLFLPLFDWCCVVLFFVYCLCFSLVICQN